MTFFSQEISSLCEVGGAPSSVYKVTLHVGEVVPQG